MISASMAGSLDAECLDIQLVELTISTLLRSLITKHRAKAVQLRDRESLLEAVLHERSDHARRGFGP